jgi:hypothetical protein
VNDPIEFTQAPTDRINYGFLYSRWLVDGDLIAASVWSAPSPLVVSSQSVNGAAIVRCGITHPANTATAAFFTGGVSGGNYVVSNTITTNQGLIYTRWLRLFVIDF